MRSRRKCKSPTPTTNKTNKRNVWLRLSALYVYTPITPTLTTCTTCGGWPTSKIKKGLLDFISEQDPTERDPKSVRAAFDAFKQLIDRYPNSQYVPDARDRLNYLLDAMAQYEVHVANYYYRRGAYVAAVNRAQNVVRDYPGSESAKSALRIQVLSYEAMGMKELRDDAERVYQLNFSEADAANASGTKKPWWRVW